MPGCLLSKELVGVLNGLQDYHNGVLQVVGIKGCGRLYSKAKNVEARRGLQVWHLALAILLGDVRCSVHKVTQTVCQLGVVHGSQALLAVRNVSPEWRSICQVKPEGVRRELVELLVGVDNIAQTFGHLLALFVVDEAVSKHTLWKWNLQAHQHAWPDDTMEPDDILADQMHIRGPELVVWTIRAIHARQVVSERVEPNIHDV
mmetsp:Transcript_28567/g.44679  ORF Transcript_28567/g.44679 Transcript_28567/m.44679 type:complete len:203 (+) Transcript_28567:1846-2454(+)